jgi:hypothetical protein
MSGLGAIGVVIAVVGGLVLGGTFLFGGGSVRDYLDDHCRYERMERDRDGRRARAYSCKEKPAVLASKLAGDHKPADRRSSPAGHFLRYDDKMVGILGPQPAGGSRVLLADERDGYGYFNGYVGGFWGSYGGPGETFRGGGPGGGK